MGGPWRLRTSWSAAAQPPADRFPGAGDRAVGRIEIRFLDLQRTVQTARACQLFFRGRQRDRLGEAGLSRLRPVEIYVLEEILKTWLFRRACGKGEVARAGIVPLVLRKPQEGRAGSATATVRLQRRIPARAANPVRQARIRMQFAQALQ